MLKSILDSCRVYRIFISEMCEFIYLNGTCFTYRCIHITHIAPYIEKKILTSDGLTAYLFNSNKVLYENRLNIECFFHGKIFEIWQDPFNKKKHFQLTLLVLIFLAKREILRLKKKDKKKMFVYVWQG